MQRQEGRLEPRPAVRLPGGPDLGYAAHEGLGVLQHHGTQIVGESSAHASHDLAVRREGVGEASHALVHEPSLSGIEAADVYVGVLLDLGLDGRPAVQGPVHHPLGGLGVRACLYGLLERPDLLRRPGCVRQSEVLGVQGGKLLHDGAPGLPVPLVAYDVEQRYTQSGIAFTLLSKRVGNGTVEQRADFLLVDGAG